MSKRPPKLPRLLSSKIYKTGQTRGADDDVIFQNRVNRNNTVLIPYDNFEKCKKAPNNKGKYENGFIVLINPDDYFEDSNFDKKLKADGLTLGKNALLFYYSRKQWNTHNPKDKKIKVAKARNNPLGGKYVARVPATTASKDKKIRDGYSSSSLKGAGIRVYEYASSDIITKCQIQLELIYWKCVDSKKISIEQGMKEEEIKSRIEWVENTAKELMIDNLKKLQNVRILDKDNNSICPLCLEKISAQGFYSKVKQAEGRAVSDLTVTQLNLFHIIELRTGEFNHRPYNLGWGHHHCNIVVKDAGINETLQWMNSVIERNVEAGFKFD